MNPNPVPVFDGRLLSGVRSVRKRGACPSLRGVIAAASLWSLAAPWCDAAEAPATAPAVLEDPWQTRLPAFSLEAPPRGATPILLYFSAGWCGFCRQMDRTTLAEPEVRARVGGLRAHKLDFDEQTGLVKRFGVSGIPAFILTNDRGEVIDRLTGAHPKEEFLSWLDQAGAEFTRKAQTAEARAEALRTLPTEARSEDAAVRARAFEALWTVAGRGDEAERGAASSQLRDLAEKDGGVWRTGLSHADLAIRVAAANLLRESRPDHPDFDPWADEATRAAALAALRL